MDESTVSSKRKFRVLSSNANRPVRPEHSQFPHITGVVTIFGDGSTMPPMFILPKKKKIDPQLEAYDAFYTMSSSGWMNRFLFTVYCIYFIAEVQKRRADMLPQDAAQPFLLLVDGHPSRLSFYANDFLRQFNIDLLVFPVHTSHILQPLLHF
ncbi:hypothetical protein TVAG_435120 [Trichomonas vaginalis G3]|uniref:DDE-1 domain-containing protein n=1 Tax=Trichomonas vaginalis (strain ATCC PRA-98 / G3) TaxID=412133 RepID=A2FXL1_TRIV3|nr:DDE endonuclease family [Trichomonas vaginalis G3]EAX90359.1 hypothetical protein TVAG_435120 [Trichomonas vaginalis G3]KAI5543965.1 DDE endonuclease family [Trichomonas vaginalis G3]|eukprot:XP_001303289.1 hypothetical protein [Trichomonas vaginalis G3]